MSYRVYTDKDIDSYINSMYCRSWPFMGQEQLLLRMNTKLLFGGVGMSSQTLELLTRSGFVNLTFADGDHFEMPNKNRQNCVDSEIGVNKALALKSRLMDINSRGNYNAIETFLTKESIDELLPKCDYFINCIDFDSPSYIYSHEKSKRLGITEIFPFVLGHHCVVMVSDKHSLSFNDYFNTNDPEILKKCLINYCVNLLLENLNEKESETLEKQFKRFRKHSENHISDPQCAMGVYTASWLITNILIDLTSGIKPKTFPNVNFR